jgi:hypothetical protein
MKKIALITILFPFICLATPSTTYWGPTTATCQPYLVPHITYDTYFAKGPTAGQEGAPVYPVDAGLTVGFLPFEKIQGEIGFDLLYPSQEPFFMNGKFCTPESSIFEGSPSIGLGTYSFGLVKDVTDYHLLYLNFQKTLPWGGYLSIGGYRGFNKSLFASSVGNVHQEGFLVGATSPDFMINLKGLKKIQLAADIQTGKNLLGAWGGGAYIYFTDDISLLTGPVYFFDPNLQPGQSEFLWTMQLDINVSLDRI